MTPTSARLALLAAKYGAAHFRGDLADRTQDLIDTLPAPHRVSLDSASQYLASCSSPLLLACLPPSRELLVWAVPTLPDAQRTMAESQVRNAASYLSSKATSVGLSRDDSIHVATDEGSFEVQLPALEAWTSAVAVITAGWTIRSHEGKPWLVFVGADRSSGAPFGPRPRDRDDAV